jgi:hypothetical protein
MTKITEIDGWKVESFYFGNATWPSDSEWRTKGNQLQVRVEREVMEYQGNPDIPEIAKVIEEFKRYYLDVTTKEYPPREGFNERGAFFVIGWWDRTGDLKALANYRQDQESSM